MKTKLDLRPACFCPASALAWVRFSKSSLSQWAGSTIFVLLLATTLSLAQSVYTPYTFSTLAGSAGQLGSADGTGSGARFSYPNGLAVDNGGTAYAVDYNMSLRKVTPQGVVTTLPVGLNHPVGVAVDAATNVYIANVFDHTIVKVTPLGVVTTLAGLASRKGSQDGIGSAARFNNPCGVAVDGAGNVYVADTANNTIRKVTPGGAVTTLAGLAQFDGFGNPVGGSADGTGSTARFNAPWGVAVDAATNIYVADTVNQTIRKVTGAGEVTTLAGQPESAGSADGAANAARFNYPFAVAVDGLGNIYVADRNNHIIRKLTPAGMVTTLAGQAESSGDSDGTGSEVQFNMPSSVAVDSAGNVFVADESNHTIRKGFPAPVGCRLSGPGFLGNSSPFGFLLSGPTGALVVVEGSTDLLNWLPLWTNTFAGDLQFTDPQSSTHSNRFYRAQLP